LLREEADPAAARAFFLRCVALTFRSSWRSAGDVFMVERALRKASSSCFSIELIAGEFAEH
jgi:hypothetical protein